MCADTGAHLSYFLLRCFYQDSWFLQLWELEVGRGRDTVRRWPAAWVQIKKLPAVFSHTGSSVLPDTFHRHSSSRFLMWPLQIQAKLHNLHQAQIKKRVFLSLESSSLTNLFIHICGVMCSWGGKKCMYLECSGKPRDHRRRLVWVFEFSQPEQWMKDVDMAWELGRPVCWLLSVW